ncbi:hypothetical protein D9756_011155 [Leucocoprinus leucothites]|uniref:Uncharacterized protein n=1 Tax=Leucocoprinus leucothites TaxID=201217 RepID=A0A8H5CP62_9AGAR|nr:hypothetical protein D9756_011155 [Leucoagaricus leucothites]
MANVAFEALVTQVWVMIEVDMTEATVMEVSWCGRKEVVEMVRELNVMVDENENAREGRYERYLQLRRARRPNILDRIALRGMPKSPMDVQSSMWRIMWEGQYGEMTLYTNRCPSPPSPLSAPSTTIADSSGVIPATSELTQAIAC